jgi:hypothetical protein
MMETGLRTGNHTDLQKNKNLFVTWGAETALKILINYAEPTIIEYLSIVHRQDAVSQNPAS